MLNKRGIFYLIIGNLKLIEKSKKSKILKARNLRIFCVRGADILRGILFRL